MIAYISRLSIISIDLSVSFYAFNPKIIDVSRLNQRNNSKRDAVVHLKKHRIIIINETNYDSRFRFDKSSINK